MTPVIRLATVTVSRKKWVYSVGSGIEMSGSGRKNNKKNF
jgi:hypothetical protein